MLSNAYCLANFVVIQPRTSPPNIFKNLQKNANNYFAKFAGGLTACPGHPPGPPGFKKAAMLTPHVKRRDSTHASSHRKPKSGRSSKGLWSTSSPT